MAAFWTLKNGTTIASVPAPAIIVLFREFLISSSSCGAASDFFVVPILLLIRPVHNRRNFRGSNDSIS
jgi:hypothetical protein